MMMSFPCCNQGPRFIHLFEHLSLFAISIYDRVMIESSIMIIACHQNFSQVQDSAGRLQEESDTGSKPNKKRGHQGKPQFPIQIKISPYMAPSSACLFCSKWVSKSFSLSTLTEGGGCDGFLQFCNGNSAGRALQLDQVVQRELHLETPHHL